MQYVVKMHAAYDAAVLSVAKMQQYGEMRGTWGNMRLGQQLTGYLTNSWVLMPCLCLRAACMIIKVCQLLH